MKLNPLLCTVSSKGPMLIVSSIYETDRFAMGKRIILLKTTSELFGKRLESWAVSLECEKVEEAAWIGRFKSAVSAVGFYVTTSD